MKPQDIVFVLGFLVVLYARNSKIAALLGVVCLFASIPLFSFWVFFTAERLTWYAAALFLLSALLQIFAKKQTQTS